MSVARGAFSKVIYEYALSPEANEALGELETLDAGAMPTHERAQADIGRGEQLFERTVVDLPRELRVELQRSRVEQVHPAVARGHRGQR